MPNYYVGGILASSDDLFHFGILGMKWGVRRYQNPDGTLTAAGKERYSTKEDAVRAVVKNSKYNEDISDKVFSLTNADKAAIAEAKKVLEKDYEVQKEITKQCEKLLSGLEDKGEENYYYAVAEIAAYNDFKKVDDLTLRDVCDAAYMGIFEDGGQSSINGRSMYTYKFGLEKKCYELFNKGQTSYNEAKKAAADILDVAINKVNTTTIKPYEAARESLGNVLARRMVYSHYDDWASTSGLYLLNDCLFAKNFTSEDKSAIAKAEKIASNLHNTHDSSSMSKNTWYLLNQAVENLGLSNEKAMGLSQSDWDKINAEISRLRE